MEQSISTDEVVSPGEGRVDDLRTRALELLDFPAVRDRVAARAGFPGGRDLARRIEPSYDVDEVERLQAETADGLAFLEAGPDVDLHLSEDPSLAVKRAGLDGVLTGMELLAVAALLEVLERARTTFLRTRRVAPLLAQMAEGVVAEHELRQRIASSFGGRGEVMDGATPGLGPLRRGAREAYQRVSEALEGLTHSPLGRDVLQDDVVSVRGDRLVVQVKAEMRHRVPGMVHDASNSGATLFVEPFATVELCNNWRELVLEEQREVDRVLRELSSLVGAVAPQIRHGIELTAQIDLIMARARYSASIRGVNALNRRRTGDEDRPVEVHLVQARHPLLGDDAVPIQVTIGPGWTVLVVTGPNTGGKTVAMKTVGLLAEMQQAGLRVPAGDGSRLPVFNGIYADIGDQQSIQGSVSTFGAHMRSVIEILAHADRGSLVLLDELGTSTDPEEGSALAKAILGHLAARGIPTVATTHHRTVAAYAGAQPGMMNASVDLDAASLNPTYTLTTGVPGRSYAMSVAAQIGMLAEIMDSARSLMEPQHMRFEDWLGELQEERTQLKESLEEASATQHRADRAREELDAQLRELALRREDMLRGVRRNLAERFLAVDKKLGRAEAALSWGSSEVEVEEAKSYLASAHEEAQALERAPRVVPPASVPHRPLAVGDPVEVRGLGLRGTVVSLPDRGEEIEVAVGDLRFRLDAARLSPVQIDAPEHQEEQPVVSYDLGPLLPTTEISVRGLRAYEALAQVDEFLDRAVRDGLGSVRVIHGRGTGALRRAVRELLERHSLVASFGPEVQERGGDGVTVVELA